MHGIRILAADESLKAAEDTNAMSTASEPPPDSFCRLSPIGSEFLSPLHPISPRPLFDLVSRLLPPLQCHYRA
jgi:hypothetical protein